MLLGTGVGVVWGWQANILVAKVRVFIILEVRVDVLHNLVLLVLNE